MDKSMKNIHLGHTLSWSLLSMELTWILLDTNIHLKMCHVLFILRYESQHLLVNYMRISGCLGVLIFTLDLLLTLNVYITSLIIQIIWICTIRIISQNFHWRIF